MVKGRAYRQCPYPARADIPRRRSPSSLRPENIGRANPGSHGTLIAKFVPD
ncbi:hypothetical protein CCACVL1_22142 [Corchorus capsularis]|uniref:Uncharacterized protein n=1 Tax=Corchorus capsularis TaxID=210143 RepID=A0A1R3H0U3_COCAP|nr:hypothetical protein CCACVL1_22142 [Corchorus capsularis]